MTQINGEIYHVCGLENRYSENEYTTPNNLYIQRNPYQATNGSFSQNWNNITICVLAQINSNSERNLEKEDWNRKNQPS